MKIKVETNFNSNIIEQIIKYEDHFKYEDTIVRHVCDLREEGVRQALIKLGWTPPKE